MFEINTTTVFVAALITALATGLGAVPFFFFKEIPRKWLGVSNAIAAGRISPTVAATLVASQLCTNLI